MTLPLTGLISTNNVKSELGISSDITFNDVNCRNLAKKYAGIISLNDFHGKLHISNPLQIIVPTSVEMYNHSNGPFAYTKFIDPTTYSTNATNLHFIFTASGGAPAVDSNYSYSWGIVRTQALGNYTYSIKRPSESTGSELVIPADLPQMANVDVVISGNNGAKIDLYTITCIDNYDSSVSINIGVGLWW